MPGWVREGINPSPTIKTDLTTKSLPTAGIGIQGVWVVPLGSLAPTGERDGARGT